jgi:hypothetical protein
MQIQKGFLISFLMLMLKRDSFEIQFIFETIVWHILPMLGPQNQFSFTIFFFFF